MKAKSQGPISSELDAKEKLIVYVYEYLSRSGAKRAADAFLQDINYGKDVSLEAKDGPGFLANWWCVFWDLYCAAPDKRGTNQAEPTSEARAFVEYNMRPIMSPNHQTSPPQPPQPYMQPGPRGAPHHYGPPPTHPGVSMRHGPPPPMNAGPPRMQMGQPLMPPQMMGGGPPMPHSHGPPMPNGPPHGPPPPQQQIMGGAPSPRYAPHPGHMTPIPAEPGPSPGLVNRMTPNHVGSPHPQIVGSGPPPGPSGPPPPGSMHPSVGMPSHSPMSHPPPPPPTMQQQRGGGGGGPGGWQGGYGSPAEQCFMPGPPGGQPNEFGGMMMNDGQSMMEMKPPQQGTNTNNNNTNNTPTNPQQDDYVMPGAYGQSSDQGGDAGSEIRKLKESLESDTNDGDQTGFNMDFADSQGKW